MSKGEKIYQAVTLSADLESAVAALSAKKWSKLHGHLLRTYVENATSGMVLGMMLVEGAKRYAAQAAKRKKTREVLG